MATKLRKMHLTSVDLVRAGANQEADIKLFKSAFGEPEETEPTPADTIRFYGDSIYKSLDSIDADETLSDIEKAEMMYKSLDEYREAMNGVIRELYGEDPGEVQKAAEEPEFDEIEEV